MADFAAGTRVVVTTKMDGEKAVVTEGKIGATSDAPAPPATPHKH